MKPKAPSSDKPLVGAWVDLLGPAYEAAWWGSVMTICCAPVVALVQVIGGRSPWASLALVLPAGAFLVLAEFALSGMV